MKKVQVLIVEDSPTARQLLYSICDADPRLLVVGQAERGEEALSMVPRLKPDVISMDLRLPGMSGLDTVRRLMADHPTPIVVIATDADKSSFEAMRAGVLSVVEKPVNPSEPGFAEQARRLCDQLVLMSEVRVIRQRPPSGVLKPAPRPVAPTVTRGPRTGGFTLVGIGASTGGPSALSRILGELPPSFPLPVLVVQHISPGFTESFASWLGSGCRLPVRVAQDGEIPLPGYVYLPAERHHLCYRAGRMRLDKAGETEDCPSANKFFHSLAEEAPHSIGVLLTGMGSDGARGLLALREAGGHTIIEDRSTAVVYGMPGAAESLGAAAEVRPLPEIAQRLVAVVQRGPEG